MAVLTDDFKREIVLQLARFRRPAEVVEYMRDVHDIEVTVQQVRTYDPTNPRFEADRDKWEPVFNAAREAYTSDIKQVVVANQSWRLNELHDLYAKAKKAKNHKLCADLLEQISRECGGAFTNSRELNVNDARKPANMDSEDRKAMLGAIIGEAIDKLKEQQGAQPTKH